MLLSSGTSLKHCIVGCYGSVIFDIKACFLSNFGATLFGFEQYTTKNLPSLPSLYNCILLSVILCFSGVEPRISISSWLEQGHAAATWSKACCQKCLISVCLSIKCLTVDSDGLLSLPFNG